MKIKNLLLFLVVFTLSTACGAQTSDKKQPPAESIRLLVDQLGYLPNATKVALLSGNTKALAGNWQLVDTKTGEPVTSGKLDKAIQDPKSRLYTYRMDFTDISKPGTYQLKFKTQQSVSFPIAARPYDDLLVALLRSYYLQRCGIKIVDKVTGIKKEICHLDDGILAHDDGLLKAFTKVPATGGWHDAGDYGKYVATTAVVAYELLSRYERYQDRLASLTFDIPKSQQNLPDFLEEMRVGLDWMLKMQREDGAVYRKLSGKQWPPIVSPDKDTQQRFVYGISSPETGKAAAAWALAARIYKPYDAKLAHQYLSASQNAMAWLEQQPEMIFDFHEGDNKGSGPYSKNKIDQDAALLTHDDDLFAAAVELYLSTGKPVWKERIISLSEKQELTLYEWKNIAPQSMMNLLWHEKDAPLSSVCKTILNKLKARADKAYARVKEHAFDIANHRLIWGSNKMTAEEGILLAQAAYYFNKPEYLDAAWTQLHYLLGRNPFDQTFVTGFGSHPVKNLHHIFATAENLQIPGMLVGGPNQGAQAGIAPKNRGVLSYTDSKKSYATNEYAIDYNSALISLLLDLQYLKPGDTSLPKVD